MDVLDVWQFQEISGVWLYALSFSWSLSFCSWITPVDS
jgi:hypothetical protein